MFKQEAKEEKNNSFINRFLTFIVWQDLKEKCSLLESRKAESQEKISKLEKKLKEEMKAGKAKLLEKEELEKVITEQQKIMKLALARILPRKSEIQFCQVHNNLKDFIFL